MRTRKGRRIAVASIAGVGGLGGVVAWLGRERVRFALASESTRQDAHGCDAAHGVGCPPAVTEFRRRSPEWGE